MLSSLSRALVLVLAGSAAGLALNGLRPQGVALRAFAAPTMCESEVAPLEEISPAAAAGLCGRSDVVVADTRTVEHYAEGHVAGAIHLPCDAGGSVAQGALAQLAAARMVLVYGEATDDARPVAESLRRHHLARVAVLRGGFAAWNQAGQACASGPCDDCVPETRR